MEEIKTEFVCDEKIESVRTYEYMKCGQCKSYEKCKCNFSALFSDSACPDFEVV
jgi:hypothetical protein